jgi:hypothetical protein
MNGGAHISQEDLALYAMNSLHGEELAAVRSHLPACAECREELAAISNDLVYLAMSSDPLPVPANAKQRLIDSISKTASADRVLSPVPTVLPVAKPSRTAWIPWAIAAALAITAGGMGMRVNTLRQQLRTQSMQVMQATEENLHSQRVVKLLMEPSAQRVTLKASKTPAEPTGHAIYLAERGELLFQGSNLKPLPSGKTYELWLIPSSGAPIPAGLFRPDQSGDASVVMPPLPAGVAAKAFGVTIENAQGSATPTAPIVLSGAPASGE